MNYPDCCIIVATNQGQADRFRQLIDKRIESKLFPREITFLTYSDPENGRVGSGGGTLYALRRLQNEFGDRFKRLLMIHAAGECRRLPCYVPEGKVFAPVAVPSSSIITPTVFDAQLTLFLKYPWRDRELIIASGDVVLDFDTDLVPVKRGDICGFAKSASCEQGSRHGVFKLHRDKINVIDYYQKASPDFLRKNAAIEGSGECALDVGLISFSPTGLEALISVGDIKTDSKESINDLIEKGKLNFDVYVEIMTACLKNIGLQDYIKATQKQSSLTTNLLKSIHRHFKEIDLHVVLQI